MSCDINESSVLKLSSLVAGGAAAAVLLAPEKFQDAFYEQSVPRASLSVTRHHGIALAGLAGLTAVAASADRDTQRGALGAAGATWLASGLLNIQETADGQTKKSTYGMAAANCALGALCLWKACSGNNGGGRKAV